MQVSSLKESEVEFLVNIQPDGWGDIRPHHYFYTTHDFCHPIKVVDNDLLVGIGTGIVHHDIAWIAHVIVHSDYRNRGLGRLITQTVMDTVLKCGCRSLNLIATDLGAPVYEKLGFTTDTEYLFFKEIRTDTTSQKVTIVPFEDRFRQAIHDLDHHASGEMRDLLIGRHLQKAMVCVVNEKVIGYYLPTLGDGLIIAENDEAGTALMHLRLSASSHACFPSGNRTASEVMRDYGYHPNRVAKRMFYGDKPRWTPKMMFNRIGGNLG